MAPTANKTPTTDAIGNPNLMTIKLGFIFFSLKMQGVDLYGLKFQIVKKIIKYDIFY
jgi:hypothetical protein